MQKMISVVVPCFNEERYISRLLDFLLKSDALVNEIFIVDGGSTDGTIALINEYCRTNSKIVLIHNKHKYVPQALNMAIPLCNNDIIVRLDAHTLYAEDYFEKIIETFNATSADIVGGPFRNSFETPFQEAVALCTSSKFGTGDSKVHDLEFEGYSNHVAYGAFKKDIFNDVGYFDERFVRNQDDEFNYRATIKGKKIYLTPKIKLFYYPRSTSKSLFKQYFQYGVYKPLVLFKNKEAFTIRFLIPSFFVIYFVSLPIAFLFKWWIIPLLFYMLLDFCFAAKGTQSVIVKLSKVIVYPILHLSYGAGVIWGFLNLRKISRAKSN